MPIRSRHHPDRSLGVVPPAVRVGEFFAAVMQAADLIFEARAIMLVDDGRRDEYEQVALYARVLAALEEIAKKRDVTHDWNFGARFGNLIL